MQKISKKMLNWYNTQARIFPWRVSPEEIIRGVKPSPYYIWLSEIMLQQTITSTVKSYFEKFTQKWENIFDLANAPIEEVMSAWAGLGYYSRARNLHETAKTIVNNYNGIFPSEQNELKKLKGIGEYTSGAIASIAFNKKSYVVDGNIERIISRVFMIEEPLPKSKNLIRDYAYNITPEEYAGNYIQSMMDLGATICLPKNPKCLLCPIREDCLSYLKGNPAHYPRKEAKQKKPDYHGQALIITNDKSEILLLNNPHKGLFNGMDLFPYRIFQKPQAIEKDFDDKLDDCFNVLKTDNKIGNIKHVFTHFSLDLEVFQIKENEISIGEYLTNNELEKRALPSLMKKILRLI